MLNCPCALHDDDDDYNDVDNDVVNILPITDPNFVSEFVNGARRGN